jgi:hypothetical protein
MKKLNINGKKQLSYFYNSKKINYMSFNPVTSGRMFISYYRQIEKATPKSAEHLIRTLEEHEPTADHLCDSWAGREQDWGSFYLNLSHDFQYKILAYWGMRDFEGDEYAKEVVTNPMKMLFADLPDCIMWPHELLKFFYNHGIQNVPTPGITLTASTLPADKDRAYGNSANWGDYVLGLSETEQDVLLQRLFIWTKELKASKK